MQVITSDLTAFDFIGFWTGYGAVLTRQRRPTAHCETSYRAGAYQDCHVRAAMRARRTVKTWLPTLAGAGGPGNDQTHVGRPRSRSTPSIAPGRALGLQAHCHPSTDTTNPAVHHLSAPPPVLLSASLLGCGERSYPGATFTIGSNRWTHTAETCYLTERSSTRVLNSGLKRYPWALTYADPLLLIGDDPLDAQLSVTL